MNSLSRRRRFAAAVFAALTALSVHAQADTTPESTDNPAPPTEATDTPPKPKSAEADYSPLTADLFYEVLIGEMNARSGDAQGGYAMMLDAARRLNDPRLFRRAAEMAMQSRSGEAALEAVRAWQASSSDPRETREARRLELQILLMLNRISETGPLLRSELAATPQSERPALVMAIARSYARASDKPLAAKIVEEVLSDELANPATAAPAWAAIGRVRLAAGDTSGAFDALIQAQEADPGAEPPALLALDMMSASQPRAEPMVRRYLDKTPDARPDLRMVYARKLTEMRRYPEAIAQLLTLTERHADVPEPWLLLGGLQAQVRQDVAAEKSVKRYVALRSKKNSGEDAEDSTLGQGLTQAYFLLSQLAERRKDYAGAETWLARVDDSDSTDTVQIRRATLLAKQGKVTQARAIVRAMPEPDAEGKQRKFQAEIQILRDAKDYKTAYDMLAEANAAAPGNADLLYDQAMLAEQLNRLEDMERLLRQLIELQPNNQNAYNALGYSLANRNLRLQEARELILKAVALAPDDPLIADSLGWVEYRLGNTGEASRILEDAYKRQPDPEIGAHLGEVLWVRGERNRAIAIWKEAAQADARNQTLQQTLKRLRVKL